VSACCNLRDTPLDGNCMACLFCKFFFRKLIIFLWKEEEKSQKFQCIFPMSEPEMKITLCCRSPSIAPLAGITSCAMVPKPSSIDFQVLTLVFSVDSEGISSTSLDQAMHDSSGIVQQIVQAVGLKFQMSNCLYV